MRTAVAALVIAALPLVLAGCAQRPPAGAPYQPLLYPSDTLFTEADADNMAKAAKGRLAPVYAPLAEYLVEHFDLADRRGIGIDLGSGPGTLIVELVRRSKLYWINADINPHFFPGFGGRTSATGVGDRVGAIFADAHALPFRNDYADIVVSRGTYQFWQDKVRAFGEVQRVLKPGGAAFIGRGLAPTMPVEAARKTVGADDRAGGPEYDPDQAETELRGIMKALHITDYRIIRPHPPGSEGINYGIWIEWRK
ncbi:MAG: hypothetical protein BIFFINMI_02164 [Phycisphaerae bacterium]|nr:hypothetical protein [Phycisphaerae bacterium]